MAEKHILAMMEAFTNQNAMATVTVTIQSLEHRWQWQQ